ncbi:MAG: four helix bundle protein [Bacteroidales bacterium]|nr:four helix bundle protein [Bacteroidales bacterium]
MRNFREYEIWQKAIEISIEVYNMTADFPAREIYSISNQLQRASVSIASNIAEGSSRTSEKEFSRYLEYALGSAYEVETQITIASKLKYIDQKKKEEFLCKLTILEKQINQFRNKLK